MKLTITGKELGCSDLPDVVLKKTEFGDRNKQRDKHWKAAQGVESIDEFRYQDALDRGNFLQEGVAEWARFTLQKFLDSDEVIHLHEPDVAYRLDDIRLGGSLDYILTLPSGSTLRLEHDGVFFDYEGQINMEVKTDFYHKEVCKPMWTIQTHGQMMVSGIKQSIVAVLTQKGKLRLYPVLFDQGLADTIAECCKEFWHLVDNNEHYPPLADEEQKQYESVDDLMETSNVDLVQLCQDHKNAMAESRSWSKTAGDIKDSIVQSMELLNKERIQIGQFQIESTTVTKPKKMMVDTDETTQSHVFKIKEVKQ